MKSFQSGFILVEKNPRLIRSSVCASLLAVTLSACGSSEASVEQKSEVPVKDTITREVAAKVISPDIARYFDGVEVKSTCPNDTTCVYLQTFPGGATREITLVVQPNRQYTPTAGEIGASTAGGAPIYGFKYASTGQADGTVAINMNYYVAKAGLPSGPPKTASFSPRSVVHFASRSTMAPRDNSLVSPAASDGAGIAWTEVGKKGADVTIGALIDKAGAKVGPLGSIYSLASSLSDVTEALDLSRQSNKWMKELDALETCAANPTNRLSISDPNYSKTTVATVRAARSELKEVTGVRFLNKLTEKSTDLTPVTAVMSVGLKDGFVWSEQTLADYSENTIMREARKAVVECTDPGDAAGNLVSVWDCNSGPEHQVHTLVADVTWEWQGGVLYLPKGNFTFKAVRTIGPCTEIGSGKGNIANNIGYMVVFPPERAKELGYGYEVRFVGFPAEVTTTSNCRPGYTLPLNAGGGAGVIIHGYLGAGGTIQGEIPANACHQASVKWSFTVPPAK